MADPLGAVVRRFVRSLREGTTPLELELRMGRQHRGGFTAAVTQSEMDAAVRALTHGPPSGTEDSIEWAESHDYFYHAGDEVVRSSVAFDSAAFRMDVQHIVKKRLEAADTARFRVSCASERPVDAQHLPFATALEHTRIKQRRSVSVCPPELSVPLWRYDFTLVWGGRTKEDAELRQRSEPPTYEVEVEVLPEGARSLMALLRAQGAGAAVDEHLVAYLSERLTEIGAALAAL
jgi:hypothetical protein